MIDFPTLSDARIRERLASLESLQFTGRVMAVYENGRILRIEISERMHSDHGFPRDGTVTEPVMRKKFQALPRDLYGRITFYLRAGIVTDLEVSESLKPWLDRERGAFVK